MRVLVPIDDTTASEAALPEAVRLVAASGEIVLVSVGELAETAAHGAAAREALQKRLAEISDRLAPIPVATRVELTGDPVRGILDVAAEVHADRIVMATEQEGLWELLARAHDVSAEVTSGASPPVCVVDVRREERA